MQRGDGKQQQKTLVTGDNDEDVHLEPVPVLLQHPDVVAVLLVLLEQSRVLVFELVTL